MFWSVMNECRKWSKMTGVNILAIMLAKDVLKVLKYTMNEKYTANKFCTLTTSSIDIISL